MFVGAMILLTGFILGICLAGTGNFKIANLLFCCLGAFLFSFYLLCDTQMIIGGKHRRFQFQEDDYILGALVLYLDIINLFLEILRLLGDN
jgi:FtsH-binding integral membrane protein